MDSLQLEEMMVAQNIQWRNEELGDDKLRFKRNLFQTLYEFLEKNRLVGIPVVISL